MRAFLIAASVVILLALLIIVGLATDMFGFFYAQHITQPIQRSLTVSDPNRSISNRSEFYSLVSSIIAQDKQIEVLNVQIANYHYSKSTHSFLEQQEELSRENDQAALQTLRSNIIGQYNADANNPDINRDRDTCLPSHIDVEQDLQGQIDELSALCSTSTP